MMATLEHLADWLLGRDEIAITAHLSPDGDAVGTTLAIMHALRALGKRCYVTLHDPVPRMYRFLPGADAVAGPDAPPFMPRHVLLVDCAEPARTGAVATLIEQADDCACLDHHVTSGHFGAVCVVDAGAAAAGELALGLMDALNAPLTSDIALCLYTAIVTDCGNFSYSNTTPHTMRAAARCLEAGVDVFELNYRLFRCRSAARTRLLGGALAGLELKEDGRVAVIRVTRDMLDRFGASEEDVEKIVNYGVEIDGVEVALLIEERGGEARLSLRSKRFVDVSAVALGMGGGGHARAAGATVPGPISAAEARALARISAALKTP